MNKAAVCAAAMLVGLALAFSPPAPPVVYDVANLPTLKTAATGGTQYTLDPARPYALYHTGKTTAGAAATDLVAIGYEANPTAADYSLESNKLVLESGGTVLIDRGTASVYLKSAAGSPVIQFVPRVSALVR